MGCVIFYSIVGLFADDSRLYKVAKCAADAADLENDLQRVVQWFTVNNLRINYEKSKAISFSKGAPTIATSYSLNGSVLPKVMPL